MSRLTIYRDAVSDATIVSNRFIDEYMKDANDAQIKIYLYLMRMMSANLPTSISDIADKFNHTEKDVVRALTYWEKQHLMKLDFDDKGEICGLHLQSAGNETAPQTSGAVKPNLLADASASATKLRADLNAAPAESARADEKLEKPLPQTTQAFVSDKPEAPFVKPTYTRDDLAAAKKDELFGQIIFVAETYLGRTLTSADLRSLLFIYKELHFSSDLIDYLIECCVGMEKRSMHYIESVAVAWATEGITNVEQAKKRSHKYSKTVYAVMKALGKSSSPTDAEADFVHRWTSEYSFSDDVILAACEKSVFAADTHRFEYTEGILSKWFKDGVHTLADVKAAEEAHTAAKSAKTAATKSGGTKPGGTFNDFHQRKYDYDALEKELLSN